MQGCFSILWYLTYFTACSNFLNTTFNLKVSFVPISEHRNQHLQHRISTISSGNLLSGPAETAQALYELPLFICIVHQVHNQFQIFLFAASCSGCGVSRGQSDCRCSCCRGSRYSNGSRHCRGNNRCDRINDRHHLRQYSICDRCAHILIRVQK